ncbi:unnamed protein product [Didymodactylos carnosus]|nr:unnamed protein product [Didymodactylos carnosus]CAF3700466.1 unnamed protein product [Didymodactylos carnosus]
MSLVKQTLSYIVTQLESTDRLSIVSFNDTAYPVSGLMMMNEQGKQTLENRIHSHEKLNPSGSTSIGRGLKMGIDVLNKRQTKNSLSSIFLLTDGQDIEVISYTDIMSAIPPSTTCHTYGFGSDHRVSVLSQIAEIGSGTFTYIDELKSVGDSLSHTLGSLFSCIAQNIEVKIELENGYSVAKVHSTFPTSAIPSSCVTIKIHDLNEDEKRNLVFEIHVPTVNEEDAENTQIGTASVKYIDPSSQKMLSSELTPLRLIRSNVIDDKTLLEVNYDLDVQRNRINAAKGMKEAVAYVEQRSMDQATAVLQAVIDKINASVSSQDTLCQSLIEDLNTSIKKFEHDKQKFMAYMTNMSMQQCSERGTYTSPHFSSSNAYITSSNRAQRANFQNYSS